MAKGKKKLMSSAPWRGEEEATEEFQDAKLKVTKQQPGAESVMHVPLARRRTSPIATTMAITMMIPSSRLTLSSVTASTATTSSRRFCSVGTWDSSLLLLLIV
ncbi:hypothetical protein FCV25MIE_15278 [Fagus crenata]